MADAKSREGARYAEASLLEFVANVHAEHDPGLQAAFDAPEAHGIPAIQLAQSEGKLLSLLVRMVGATRVVEVGTLAGYSAIWLAKGMESGTVDTIEFDPRHAEIARANIEVAGLTDRITVHVGAGTDILPTLSSNGPFDVVFLDADKEGYAAYGRWAKDNLRPGGLLIGDNAFLFGNLLDEGDRPAAMRRFHEETAAAFDSVCVTTPDGLVVAIRGRD